MDCINVKLPRNSKSVLTATLTLSFPDGEMTERAIRELCDKMVSNHIGPIVRAKIDFERTVRQTLPIGKSTAAG